MQVIGTFTVCSPTLTKQMLGGVVWHVLQYLVICCKGWYAWLMLLWVLTGPWIDSSLGSDLQVCLTHHGPVVHPGCGWLIMVLLFILDLADSSSSIITTCLYVKLGLVVNILLFILEVAASISANITISLYLKLVLLVNIHLVCEFSGTCSCTVMFLFQYDWRWSLLVNNMYTFYVSELCLELHVLFISCCVVC